MDVADSVAMVTGAGSGIGRAAALGLAGAGFRVVLAGRRAAALAQTADLIPVGRTLCVPTDVSDAAGVRALFESAAAAFGRIDVLFNNAGTSSPPVPFDEIDDAQWSRVVAVNLTGAFLCARAAFAQMKRQHPGGGRIINNGSISAQAPRPNSAPYTATKHALTGLTKSLALDGRAHNIACGQIDIGNARTEMAAPMASGAAQADGRIAVEATMDVEAVARAVVLMATLPPEANVLFMTVMATAMPFVGRG